MDASSQKFLQLTKQKEVSKVSKTLPGYFCHIHIIQINYGSTSSTVKEVNKIGNTLFKMLTNLLLQYNSWVQKYNKITHYKMGQTIYIILRYK